MEIEQPVVEFAGFTLAVCAAIASGNEIGEVLCPFALTQKNGKNNIVAFESESQSESVNKAYESFSSLSHDSDFWAIAHEGLITENEKKIDVFTIVAWAKGMEEKITIIKRFNPKSESNAFSMFGNTELIVEGKWLEDPTHPFIVEAISKGISCHLKAKENWSQWHL